MVIIPYFQREPGLLQRALTSIAHQDLDPKVHIEIVVIDDSSPLPSDGELDVAFPKHCSLQVIKQENMGAGASRNTGLARITEDIHAVAFLDSDDEWLPNHLQSGLDCLMKGADFYFDNSFMNEGIDSFSFFKFFSSLATEHQESDDIIFVSGDQFFDGLLQECVSHTSQVIYNAQKFREIRFNQKMKRAGEDHLFFLNLASRSEKIAFSLRVNGKRGTGVSIYRETLSWDSPKILERLLDELLLREYIRAELELSKRQMEIVNCGQQIVFAQFIFLALRMLFRHPSVTLQAVSRLLDDIPHLVLSIPRAISKIRIARAQLTVGGMRQETY